MGGFCVSWHGFCPCRAGAGGLVVGRAASPRAAPLPAAGPACPPRGDARVPGPRRPRLGPAPPRSWQRRPRRRIRAPHAPRRTPPRRAGRCDGPCNRPPRRLTSPMARGHRAAARRRCPERGPRPPAAVQAAAAAAARSVPGGAAASRGAGGGVRWGARTRRARARPRRGRWRGPSRRARGAAGDGALLWRWPRAPCQRPLCQRGGGAPPGWLGPGVPPRPMAQQARQPSLQGAAAPRDGQQAPHAGAVEEGRGERGRPRRAARPAGLPEGERRAQPAQEAAQAPCPHLPLPPGGHRRGRAPALAAGPWPRAPADAGPLTAGRARAAPRPRPSPGAAAVRAARRGGRMPLQRAPLPPTDWRCVLYPFSVAPEVCRRVSPPVAGPLQRSGSGPPPFRAAPRSLPHTFASIPVHEAPANDAQKRPTAPLFPSTTRSRHPHRSRGNAKGAGVPFERESPGRTPNARQVRRVGEAGSRPGRLRPAHRVRGVRGRACSATGAAAPRRARRAARGGRGAAPASASPRAAPALRRGRRRPRGGAAPGRAARRSLAPRALSPLLPLAVPWWQAGDGAAREEP
jgi:hypothetical protein